MPPGLLSTPHVPAFKHDFVLSTPPPAGAIHTIADLQPFTTPQLEQLLGVKPAVAQQLHGWARGLDPSPVQEREPPRTLSVQMTLTLVPRPMPAALGRVSASGGQAGGRNILFVYQLYLLLKLWMRACQVL